MKIVGFGASHLHAVVQASADESVADVVVVTLPFSAFEPAWTDGPNGRDFAPLFTRRLQVELEDPAVRLVFCSLGGGDHIALGILNSDPRFDFVIPDTHADEVVRRAQEQRPVNPGAEVIPFDLVRQTIEHRMGGSVAFFELVRSLTSLPLVLVSSPPPIADEAQIRQDRNAAFQTKLATQGLSPPLLLYKLWLVSVNAWRSMCERHGVGFVMPPPEAIGPEGFLAEACFGRDCMHANAHYGRMVIGQMAALAKTTR